MHVSAHVRHLDYSTRQYQSKTEKRPADTDPVPVRQVDERTEDEQRRREARQRRPGPGTDRRHELKTPSNDILPPQVAPRVAAAPLRQDAMATWAPVAAIADAASLWSLIETTTADHVSAPPAVAKPEPASLQDLLARAVSQG